MSDFNYLFTTHLASSLKKGDYYVLKMKSIGQAQHKRVPGYECSAERRGNGSRAD